jgi:BirA family biotin operon repressor/biotin-[acetyl-CoA-carboxylase] ligase
MTNLKIYNPFNAPVYYEETISSTMDVSKKMALEDELHGTVIITDFQEAGRGRIHDRIWEVERKTSLLFTILLRYPRIEDIPAAFTLRTGLAVSHAIENFAPSLKNRVMVKWPNDIMIDTKKAAGILCEVNDGNVHAGIGINVLQKEFPAHLNEKAASIALASGVEIASEERFLLLEKILISLYNELEEKGSEDWNLRLVKRLYKKNEQAVFIEGAADSGKMVKGRIAGIGCCGELLIEQNEVKTIRSFFTGELIFSNSG